MGLNILHSTQYIYSSFASVLDSSALTYSWLIDTTAQIDSFYIKRSTDGQNFKLIKAIAARGNKTFELTFNDSTANPSSGSYYYEVESVDTCGYQLTSNTVQTIFLTATSPSQSVNHLSWNAFELSNANVLNYTIYRIRSDGSVIAAATVLPNKLIYDDQVGDAISDNGVFCYRIVSNYVLNIPGIGLSKTYTTRSNDVCVTKDPVVFIPNAFVPGGVNNTFRPVFLFGVSEYDFRIFDRWGKEVFVTQDIVAGWDGTYHGEKLPLGGYVYQLKATSAHRKPCGTARDGGID